MKKKTIKEVRPSVNELIEKFLSRPAQDEFANAVQVKTELINKTTMEQCLNMLHDSLANLCAIKGYRAPLMKDLKLRCEEFDHGDQKGFAYKALVKKDPNASAILFITKWYYKAFIDILAMHNSKFFTLVKIERCRSIKNVKKLTRKALAISKK